MVGEGAFSRVAREMIPVKLVHAANSLAHETMPLISSPREVVSREGLGEEEPSVSHRETQKDHH